MKKHYSLLLLFIFSLAILQTRAQGVWSAVSTLAPDTNGGGMLLLSDGSVLVKSSSGGGDGIGSIYNKLTPDIHGSYANGTWSTIAPMYNTRLYYSSDVLRDGRVYVAGGEYGTGYHSAEIYDPVADSWSLITSVVDTFEDANSILLPDGTVLQATLEYKSAFQGDVIYDPVANVYNPVPSCLGQHAEAPWMSLPDNSVLFCDFETQSSERYIPSLGHWITDANVPDSLWAYSETGCSLLLPDGRAFFLGGPHNAYYTPSGNTTAGTWSSAADMPNGNGQADAPGAMMIDGQILCIGAPKPSSDTSIFNWPTSFYVFDYKSNSFTQIAAPAGSDTIEPNYIFNMLDLPDGSIMLSEMGYSQYYIYTPSGAPLSQGKPKIDNLTKIDCSTYKLTGKLFNGISQGVSYGDDWQMFTNYPIVRLSSVTGDSIYYCRSYNWNHNDVMDSVNEDTVTFTPPATLPAGTYSLVVVTNGIASSPISFIPCPNGIAEIENNNVVEISPNPSSGIFNFQITSNHQLMANSRIEVYNVLGEKIMTQLSSTTRTTLDLTGQASGVYMYKILSADGNIIANGKLVVE